MQSVFSKDMMKKVFCQGYLWLLLLLLYSPIFIIIIFSFTEAKVMGNWTGFSLQLYKNLFAEGTHHSLTAALVNTCLLYTSSSAVWTPGSPEIEHGPDTRNRLSVFILLSLLI